jgi:hypothetical protein
VFTRALHWSLSWTRSIQSIPPHIVSLICILTLSTHLCLRWFIQRIRQIPGPLWHFVTSLFFKVRSC